MSMGVSMNKRTKRKIFHRAQKKVRCKKTLTVLECNVWTKVQNEFSRIAIPIIEEIKREELNKQ